MAVIAGIVFALQRVVFLASGAAITIASTGGSLRSGDSDHDRRGRGDLWLIVYLSPGKSLRRSRGSALTSTTAIPMSQPSTGRITPPTGSSAIASHFGSPCLTPIRTDPS